MVRSGQGDRVLQIWAQLAPKEEPRRNGDGASDSPLASALNRMPGADDAPVVRLPGAVVVEDGTSAGDAGQWAADSQSAGVAGEAPQAPQDQQVQVPRIGQVLLPGQLVLGVDAGPCSLAPVLTLPSAYTPAGLRGCVPAPECVPAGALAREGASAHVPAPTPPQPQAREVIHPHGSNFDFAVEDDCWSGDEDPDEHESSSDAPVVVGIARTGAAA